MEIIKCIEASKLVEEYSNGQPGIVSGIDPINKLFSKFIYMVYNRMKIGCDLPYSNWFIDKIFYKNGVVADFISLSGLREIMSDLGLISYQTSRQLTNLDELNVLKTLFINQENPYDSQFENNNNNNNYANNNNNNNLYINNNNNNNNLYDNNLRMNNINNENNNSNLNINTNTNSNEKNDTNLKQTSLTLSNLSEYDRVIYF